MKYIFSLTVLILLSSCSYFKPYYTGPKSDHFNGERFISENHTKFRSDFRFLFTLKDSWSGDKEETISPKFNPNLPIHKARVIFIGHSTFLIQFPHLNILTDPIWSKRSGPIALPFFAPKRHNPPAIALENLPKIDYVVLSHSSYYHMDLPTISQLKEKFNPVFVTGLGNCYYLNEVKNLDLRCAELDWEQKMPLPENVNLYFLTAQNWSKRSWFDRDKTLWGSFAINSSNFKIYFAGDSGYFDHFKKIGKKYGPFDLALLPIGSYEPRWRMKHHHMNPDEAVQAHLDLNAKKSIGMHFNTFQTSDEGYYDAEIDLEKAKKYHSLKAAEFVAPKFGEIFWF